MDTTLVIRAKDVHMEFPVKNGPSVVALERINLEVPKGQLTALIGPDGAGKTTFMRLLCGLLDKTSGELDVLGLDVEAHSQEVQNLLSYMPQKFGLYEDLSVAENMTLYADLHGIPMGERPERFQKLLEMTGLSEFTSRLAGKLSGGMKQKLGLACTLVRSPDLLILDEPTVGVDPLSRRELWAILKHLVHDEHLSVFVSTAYMDEAAMCEKVYIMNHGRFLGQGTPAELSAIASGRCFEVKPLPGVAMRVLQSFLLADSRITDAVPANGAVRFITTEPNLEIPWLVKQGMTPVPIEERLEDSFMILLKDDEQELAASSLVISADSETETAVEIEESQVPKSDTDMPQLDYLHLTGQTIADDAPIDIEVENLVKQFGDFTAVANTSFQVRQGEVFGLLGPNGAGKTTTFRMLCGLLPSTSGVLNVAGVNLRHARTQARVNIGYVAQKFSLYDTLTVYENLRFFGGAYGLYGDALERRIYEIMDEFGLTDKKDEDTSQLPGGYKQRLSMAAGLIHYPKILFLDEPTSGIDPLARRNFWQQITRLSAQGTTIIITTHFMDEAEYCDRFMIQDKGRLLILGSPADIREQVQLPKADMNEIFIEIVERARDKGAM